MANVVVYIPPQQHYGNGPAWVRPVAIINDIKPVVSDGVDPRIVRNIRMSQFNVPAIYRRSPQLLRQILRRGVPAAAIAFMLYDQYYPGKKWIAPAGFTRTARSEYYASLYPIDGQAWADAYLPLWGFDWTGTNSGTYYVTPVGLSEPVPGYINTIAVGPNWGGYALSFTEIWSRPDEVVETLPWRHNALPQPRPEPGEVLEPSPNRAWQPNPNFIRDFLPSRDPQVDTSPLPDQPPQFEIEISPQTGEQPQWDIRPKPFEPVRPPRDGVKERKVRTTGTAIAVALWRMLDRLSEASDMISEVYDALPKDLRKQIEKKRGGFWWKTPEGKWKWMLPKRDADTAGQYGVSGADWKLAAIWQYHDQIDWVQATKNLAKNEIEDKLYGLAHGARDRVTFRGKYRRKPF